MTVIYRDPFGPPWQLNWLRLMFHWRGSIIQSLWLELVVACLLASLFMAGWLWSFTGERNVSDWLDRTSILQYGLDYLTRRFQAALGLMLGFYTGTLFNRWWRVRAVANEAMMHIKGTAIHVAAYIAVVEDEIKAQSEPDTAKKESSDELNSADVLCNMTRWANLAFAIAVGQFYRRKPNSFSELGNLVNEGLMTENEHQCIVQSSPCSNLWDIPILWALDLLDKVARCSNSSIPVPPAFGSINGSLSNVRSSLDILDMYLKTPIPLAYRQLVNITVRTYMLIVGINEGVQALHHAQSNMETGRYEFPATVFLMIVPFLFEYFLFVGWLTIADALGDPFRNWVDEFEWEDFVRGTFVASFELLDQRSKTTRTGVLTSDVLRKAEQDSREKRNVTLRTWKQSKKTEAERKVAAQHRRSRLKEQMTGF